MQACQKMQAWKNVSGKKHADMSLFDVQLRLARQCNNLGFFYPPEGQKEPSYHLEKPVPFN
jgi:hypothetical protein